MKHLMDYCIEVGKCDEYVDYVDVMKKLDDAFEEFAASTDQITEAYFKSLMTQLNKSEDSLDYLLMDPDLIRDIDPHWGEVLAYLIKKNSIK